MRICIPTKTDNGTKAQVSEHFGSAPYFTIYDSDTKTIETLDNSNQHHEHGTCNPISILMEKKVHGGLKLAGLNNEK